MATKSSTQKHYQNRINIVWQYIQHNLDKNLSLEEMADVACISPYHFHRIFRAYTGESVNQYSKRLRLERAAAHLQCRSKDITAIGLACGYETSAAFSKAFKQHFSVTPSEYRKLSHSNLSQYRVQPTFDKELSMEYKIVTRPQTRVLYTRRTGDYMESAPVAWQALDDYANQHNLFNEQTEMIGLCHDSPEITEKEKIRYDACIPVSEQTQADGEFGIQQLRGGEYAVFLHQGPYEKLIDTYDRISHEWIANQDRELDDAPVFEIYLNPELMETNPQELKTEIYLPLK